MAIPAVAASALGAAPSSASSPAGWRVTTLPVASRTSTSYSEPGIAAGPGGVLWADASSANSGAPAMFWLSRDGGVSWHRGVAVGGAATSTGDADGAIGSDGYLYALNLGYGANPPAQPSNPTVLVYRSRDGRHWRGPASFPPPHGSDQPDRPWLVLVPGHPNEVLLFNSEVGGNIVEWRSTDHGATFSGPTPVTQGLNSEAALTLGSRPLVDPSDNRRMFLFYETATWSALPATAADGGVTEFPLTQLWLATSTDGGVSWANQQVLDLVDAFGTAAVGGSLGHLLPASSVDPAGNLYVVLSVRLGDSAATRLYLLHSTNHGIRWSPPSRIVTSTTSNVMPAIASGADGRLFLSWYASPAASYADSGARWMEIYAATRNGLSGHPHFAGTRLSGSMPVHVGAVEVAGAVGNDFGENWGLRDFQSITLDGCGRPHVIWAVDYRGQHTMTAEPTKSCSAFKG